MKTKSEIKKEKTEEKQKLKNPFFNLSSDPKAKETANTLVSELNAISKGQHISQKTAEMNAKITKTSKFKQNKRKKKMQSKAAAVQDRLEEKISAAKNRHKLVRSYRDNEEK